MAPTKSSTQRELGAQVPFEVRLAAIQREVKAASTMLLSLNDLTELAHGRTTVTEANDALNGAREAMQTAERLCDPATPQELAVMSLPDMVQHLLWAMRNLELMAFKAASCAEDEAHGTTTEEGSEAAAALLPALRTLAMRNTPPHCAALRLFLLGSTEKEASHG